MGDDDYAPTDALSVRSGSAILRHRMVIIASEFAQVGFTVVCLGSYADTGLEIAH